MADKPEQSFSIKRIYLKDASLETPAAPEIFATSWEPKVHIDVNTSARHVKGDVHEVVLSLTATATQDDKPCLLIEVQQAGIFFCQGLNEGQLRQCLSTMCPDILFPYAREAIDALATKASFPPFQLSPMNFDVLYQQAIEQQKQQKEEDTAAH